MNSNSRTLLLELYDQYAPSLYGLILRTVKDQSYADQLLELTFLKAWERLQSNQMPLSTNRFSWLLALARSVGFELGDDYLNRL